MAANFLCLVSTNLSRLAYAGEIRNPLEMATYFSETSG